MFDWHTSVKAPCHPEGGLDSSARPVYAPRPPKQQSAERLMHYLGGLGVRAGHWRTPKLRRMRRRSSHDEAAKARLTRFALRVLTIRAAVGEGTLRVATSFSAIFSQE
jgi:hypothetical protein